MFGYQARGGHWPAFPIPGAPVSCDIGSQTAWQRCCAAASVRRHEKAFVICAASFQLPCTARFNLRFSPSGKNWERRHPWQGPWRSAWRSSCPRASIAAWKHEKTARSSSPASPWRELLASPVPTEYVEIGWLQPDQALADATWASFRDFVMTASKAALVCVWQRRSCRQKREKYPCLRHSGHSRSGARLCLPSHSSLARYLGVLHGLCASHMHAALHSSNGWDESVFVALAFSLSICGMARQQRAKVAPSLAALWQSISVSG